MRGLTFVRVRGFGMDALNGVITAMVCSLHGLVDATPCCKTALPRTAPNNCGFLSLLSTQEFSTSTSLMFLRCPLMKKDAFLLIGPLTSPLNSTLSYDGSVGANGFIELKPESFPCRFACPWNLSVPGLVKISIRPYPSLSYSVENGLLLMRISRIADFGGSSPAVNPSMYICPPFGPADGPASACRSDCNSSGSSESASNSFPLITIAPALFAGFTSSVGA